MFILNVLAVIGTVLGFVFLTLSLASGLYYISEIIESKTVYTKKVLSKLVFGIVGTYVLLMFVDGLPIKLCLFSMFSHLIYYKNLDKFPFINLKNMYFILSIILVFLNHYLWFSFFNKPETIPPQYRYDPNYKVKPRYNFPQVASFFGLLVWLVPFALFISLSANDLALPVSSEGSHKTNLSESNNTFANKTKKMESIGKHIIVICKEYFELFLNVFTGQFDKIKENRKSKQFEHML
ncbi:related to Protein SVP26 [Hanseniaspora guilliermondii]|uniref:Related to Protein SVP26 n=1 Tax=Hanseniaspora guilliermondii TaxID=56406 RepID=A0A1L0D2K8_9ASCO|nr:related to Protein SVP26 [Hanseniaspora guilliermondii]